MTTTRIMASSAFLILATFGASDAQAQIASTTVLSFSSATVATGNPVTVTATVAAGGKPVTPGLVTFCNAAVRYCGGTALLGGAQLGTNGTASIKLVLGLGPHQIKAVFSGNRAAAASASAPQTVTITGLNRGSGTLSATAGGSPGIYNLATTIFAAGTHPPTGTVSFVDTTSNNAVLATATLAPGGTQSSWAPSPLAGAGSEPYALATADFNRDGIPDVAVVDLNPTNNAYYLMVYVATAAGGFVEISPPQVTGAAPAALVSGDFNNDGIPDLAVANSNANDVSVLLGNGNGAFHTAASAPATGVGPFAIASGDFNRDGNADLAVANQSDNTVTILLGDGKGGFTAPPGKPPATGYFPAAVAVCDFNGDGKLDLAVANYFGNSVSILLGNGDGTFSAGATPATDVYPDWVSIGDFNGDGKPDLAVTNQFSATLTILLGDGKGGFTPPAVAGYVAPKTGGRPSSVAVGDLDGNGAMDLVVTNQSDNSITLLMGKGDGTFTAGQSIPTGAGSTPRSAALADFDGDGNPDIATADSGSDQVSIVRRVILSASTASVANLAVNGAGAHAVIASYAGDANDGAAFSAAVSLTGRTVTTTTALAVQPTGTVFTGQALQLTATVKPSATGTAQASGSVSFYNGTNLVSTVPVTNGTAVLTTTLGFMGTYKYSAKYLGDGLFLGSTSAGVVVTATNPPLSSINLTVQPASVTKGTPVALTATVTSGGKPVTHGTVWFCDAAAVYCQDGALLGQGQLNAGGTVTLRRAFPLGSTSIYAVFAGTAQTSGGATNNQNVSVTGTYATSTALAATGMAGNYTLTAGVTASSFRPVFGKVTFLDASDNNFQVGSAQVFAPPGITGFTPSATLSAGQMPSATVAADFNGDGKVDLIEASATQARVDAWLGNGDGTFTAKLAIAIGPSGGIVAGDFNGDGKMDVAITQTSANKVAILLGNGDGTFTMKQTVATGATPSVVVAADFNWDGNLDLAIVNSAASSLTILLGNGDGTFTATAQTVPVDAMPTSLAAGNFNGDNYPDLVVTSAGRNTVTVLTGNGRGGFVSTGISYGTGKQPRGLVLGDFNHDGGQDIAWVNSGDGTIGVLIKVGNPQFQAAAPITVGGNPTLAIAGDFDGDGATDFAVSDGAASTITFVRGNGDSMFFVPLTTTLADVPGGIAAADFDQDGGLDFAYSELHKSAAGIMLHRPVGMASATGITVPGAGMHNIVATTALNSPYLASTSAPLALAATPIPTTTFIGVAPSPIVAPGSSVQAKVNVSFLTPVNYTLSGSVSLYNGAALVGTATLTNAQATFTVAIPAAGTYQLTAKYAGSSLFSASSSNPTPVIAAPASATKLTASSQSVPAGTAVSLVAAVTTGTTRITKGTVLFCDANAAVCANTALLGTGALRADGMAAVRLTLGLGAHSVKAIFTGTTLAQASTSGNQTVTVTGLRPTTTTLASTLANGQYSLTSTVTAGGAQAPTGSVSFLNVTAGATMGMSPLTASAPRLTFAAATVPVGNFPFSIAMSDFDLDGHPDVIGTSQTTNTAFVLMGSASGALMAKAPIPVGMNPVAVAVGDFNGDGLPDAVVANANSNSVSILLGNGNGTFRTPSTVAVSFPVAVAVGDFNADGKQDIAVAGGFNTVTILLGNGDGTFKPAATPTVGAQPLAIATTDFTGDGRPDLVVVCANGGAFVVSVLVSGADGTFSLSAGLPIGYSQSVATGDLNGDGKQDLVVGLPNDGKLTVFLGNGNGTFGAPMTMTAGAVTAEAVAIADLNGDGKLDIVASGEGAGPLVLLGDGNGGFAAQPLLGVGTGAQMALAIGDFNGDGQSDIAVANYGAASVGVLLNNESTTATATLNGVTVTGKSRTVRSSYPATTVFGASTSATLSLAPTL